MQPLELALCRSISDLSGINPSDYLMEPKLDGVRLQVVIADGEVKLYTRTNHLATGKLPKVEEAIKFNAGACDGTILDGEAVFFDEQDLPDFGFTAACLGCASGKAATRQRLTGKYLSYVAFDLLYLRGLDLRREALVHRRQLIEMLVKIFDSKHIRLVETAIPSAEQHAIFLSRYGEGSVVKKLSSHYRAGRTGYWLKWKKALEEDVVVMGAEPGNGKFAGQIGAIVFGQYKDGSIVERGRCSGMTDVTRRELSDHLPIGAVMVISHNGILANGGFRHPQFRRFRIDKRVRDCIWTSLDDERRGSAPAGTSLKQQHTQRRPGMDHQGIDSQAVNKIVKARLTALPQQLGDPLPEVWVTLSDGTEKMLFTYYPDEISFQEGELIGLTEEEASLLKFGRDRAYLQS